MRRAGTLLAVAALGLAACDDGTNPTATVPDALETRVTGQQTGWIVVFDRNVQDAPGLARRLADGAGAQLTFTYTNALKGFAATMSEQAAAAMANNPNVAYVEPDAQVQFLQVGSWGLDRVDQRDLPLDGSYTPPNTGSGANVYILDTGVNISHADFGSRASYIPNGAGGDFVGDGHGSAEDCHGHGTHVAGTAAGSTYGVAKSAAIWAGRVVNCSGSGNVSMAIAGVDWITANAQQPAVVNMSLGYGNVQSLRDAVETSIAAGINYAVAAGNGNFVGIPQDACSESPAGAPNALTVGATSSSDSEASFSNYGTCVDILAPGVSITSAWIGSDNATNTISGTSMATPHVAGAVALYLTQNPSATPSQVSGALKSNATMNRISLHRRSRDGGTPNALLYTSFIGGDGGTTNSPPAASFTETCTDLTCQFTDGSTDSDGTIASWSWSFGDGASSTAQNPSHTYAAGGTYTVTLTVTDDAGATDSSSHGVTVSDGSTGGGITLSASAYKVKGVHHADLAWSGATSSSVDVYRDGSLVATTANDGAYTDNIGQKGGGVSYTYRVCEAGTTTCSNDASAIF